MVTHTCNPRIYSEAGGLLQIGGQPRLHTKIPISKERDSETDLPTYSPRQRHSSVLPAFYPWFYDKNKSKRHVLHMNKLSVIIAF